MKANARLLHFAYKLAYPKTEYLMLRIFSRSNLIDQVNDGLIGNVGMQAKAYLAGSAG